MRFGIFEPRLSGPVELQLGGIHHVEHQHLVPAMPQEPERLERQVAVEQQVRDEDHEPASPEQAEDPAQRGLRGGPLPRRETLERRGEPAPLRRAGAGRHSGAHRLVERDEARRVALAEQHQGERGQEPARVVELREAPRRAAPGHRRAHVADEHRAEVGLLLELLHIDAVVAAEQLPVDVAELVAGLVHPVLGELDRESATRGPVKSREESLDHPFGDDLQPSQAGDLDGVEEIHASGRGHQGKVEGSGAEGGGAVLRGDADRHPPRGGRANSKPHILLADGAPMARGLHSR